MDDKVKLRAWNFNRAICAEFQHTAGTPPGEMRFSRAFNRRTTCS